MPRVLRVAALAGLGWLVLSRTGRERAGTAAKAGGDALRRRRVQELPTVMVDRTSGSTAHAPATDPVDVAVEHYEQR